MIFFHFSPLLFRFSFLVFQIFIIILFRPYYALLRHCHFLFHAGCFLLHASARPPAPLLLRHYAISPFSSPSAMFRLSYFSIPFHWLFLPLLILQLHCCHCYYLLLYFISFIYSDIELLFCHYYWFVIFFRALLPYFLRHITALAFLQPYSFFLRLIFHFADAYFAAHATIFTDISSYMSPACRCATLSTLPPLMLLPFAAAMRHYYERATPLLLCRLPFAAYVSCLLLITFTSVTIIFDAAAAHVASTMLLITTPMPMSLPPAWYCQISLILGLADIE